MDPTRQIASYHDAELAHFFKRPVRIYSGTWTQGVALNVLLDPWALFFADPRVINRVTHYNLARCSLCVKFVLSGNPFLYGQLMASYMPYPALISTSSLTNDGRNPHGTGVPTELVLASQRHKVMLTPMMSEGACMKLPFFNQNNWFQTQTGDWVDFGKIAVQSMNLLKHANAGSESVSLNIFAWTEDMQLSIPTSIAAYGMVAQSGMDEYSGKVSRPASILSKAVSRVRHVPTLGPYAMATSAAASAVAATAGVLGYSRPLGLEPPTPMVQDPFKHFAATEGQDTSSKLTVDPKQGVTIDTRVMGLDGQDELGILRLAQVESYLTTFTWPVGTVADTHLFSIPVTPMLYSHWGSTPSASVVAPTALASAALPFRKWRGSIKYRFQIVCTPYHKGRLRVVYDPYNLGSLTKFNVNYTKIVDLAEVNEFEMLVSWADDKLVQRVDKPNFIAGTNNPWSTSTVYTPSQVYDNGALTVLVMNSLTAPNDTINNDIGVNVFVSAGDDFELYEPEVEGLQGICMVPQSGMDELDYGMEHLSIGAPSDGTDLSKVIIGERVVSFRQLMKRYVHYLTSGAVTGAAQLTYYSVNFRNFPLTPGSDASGLHTSTALAKQVNFVSLSLITYLASMFAGYRGSLRYKHFIYSVKSSTLYDTLTSVYRVPGTTTTALPTVVVDASAAAAFPFNAIAKHYNSFAGTAVVSTHTKPAIEVELPYYSSNRFEVIRPYNARSAAGEGHRVIADRPVSSTDVITSWVSIGEDFTYGYFVGSNLWYQYYLAA